MSGLSFPAFLEAIRRGNASDAQAGYRRLAWEFRCLHHPVFSQASRDRSGDALQQLVQEFVVHLTTTPEGETSAALLTSWLGARRQALRWARRLHRRSQSIEDKSGIFRVLLNDKVKDILRSPRFERVGRSGYRLADQPEGKGVEDDVLRERLPAIRARLHSPVEGKSPEVASRTEVEAQLERILELGGNRPRMLIELFDLVWGTLVPAPDVFLPQPPLRSSMTSSDCGPQPAVSPEERLPSLDPRPPELLEEAEWQAHLQQEARDFLDTLPERVLRIVRLRWGLRGGPPLTLVEVAARLGISKSTVANDEDDFHERYRSWEQSREIQGEQRSQLQEQIVELLRTGLPLNKEAPTP